ncbi:MAG: lipoyl protein ligase domain-containing protein, partial [Armatimonadota bacterium]
MNMAIDEAIAAAVTAEQQPPTLRFYGWEPPAVSLGYHQELD